MNTVEIKIRRDEVLVYFEGMSAPIVCEELEMSLERAGVASRVYANGVEFTIRVNLERLVATTAELQAIGLVSA